MNKKELIVETVKLSPAERFALIDELLRSLDRIDPDLDRIWIAHAGTRPCNAGTNAGTRS